MQCATDLTLDLFPLPFPAWLYQVTQDLTRAMALYAQAASQGHAKADYHLKNLRDQEL